MNNLYIASFSVGVASFLVIGLLTNKKHESHEMQNMMKAARFTRYGGPEVIKYGTVKKPVPKANQVLVKVHASTVTSGDWRVIGPNAPPGFGLLLRLAFGITGPRMKVLGQEFAGVVEKVGKDVTQFKIGDEVCGTVDTHFGAHAEYLCAYEDEAIVHKPSNMDMYEAATLAFGGITDLYFLRDLGKLKAGDKILINGASGCLGIFAIQLSKYYGAEVTAVCSAKNSDMVLELGADSVIDYKTEDFTQKDEKYDYIYDTVGNVDFYKMKKVLHPEGKVLSPVISMRKIRQMIFNSKTFLSGTPSVAKCGKEDMLFLKELVEEGKLKTIIDSKYPLEDTSKAFALVDSGRKKGNAVIQVVP